MDEAAERRKRLKSIRDAAEATPASSSEATASQHGSFVNPLAAPESSAALPAPSFTFYSDPLASTAPGRPEGKRAAPPRQWADPPQHPAKPAPPPGQPPPHAIPWQPALDNAHQAQHQAQQPAMQWHGARPCQPPAVPYGQQPRPPMGMPGGLPRPPPGQPPGGLPPPPPQQQHAQGRGGGWQGQGGRGGARRQPGRGAPAGRGRGSDLIDVSQYVNASMVENPWAALEKQHQRQHAPPPAAKPPPSTAAAGPSLADALAGAVQDAQGAAADEGQSDRPWF